MKIEVATQPNTNKTLMLLEYNTPHIYILNAYGVCPSTGKSKTKKAGLQY